MRYCYLNLYALLIVTLFSCKKTADTQSGAGNTNNKILSVISLNPSTIQINTTTVVVIKGTGFSKIAEEDSVSFNGLLAQILTATSDSLIVLPPLDGGTGSVIVTVNGKSVKGPVFTYTSPYIVSTFAGTGLKGYKDTAALFSQFLGPGKITIDNNGSLYVTDGGSLIRKISLDGNVTTIAGQDSIGYKDSIGINALFNDAAGIAVDAQGFIFVVDRSNQCIRKISPLGLVTTFAGNPRHGGYVDGQGLEAEFRNPIGLTIDNQGNLFVADEDNQRIRKVTPSGEVSTFAGNGNAGFVDGQGVAAEFNHPVDVIVDPQGNLYVADNRNWAIRKISPDGLVSSILKGPIFEYPNAVAAGENEELFITGEPYNLVSGLNPSGVLDIRIGFPNDLEGQGYVDGDGLIAKFHFPEGLATDLVGNVYVADLGNMVIRKIMHR